MRREPHVRFCERAVVKLRRATHLVVLVEGRLEQAEAERQALAEFLKQELRVELSMEKTKITDVREGFDFLGYRVTQEPARHSGNRVGKLYIPKGKLRELRHKIKVAVRGASRIRQARLVDGTAHCALGPEEASRRNMESAPRTMVPTWSRSLLGGDQHPCKIDVRATRGGSHAWRAGCRETCTSGSERGMKKLVPVMG